MESHLNPREAEVEGGGTRVVQGAQNTGEPGGCGKKGDQIGFGAGAGREGFWSIDD